MNIIHFLLLMIGNVGLLLLSFILITSADYGIEVIYYLAFMALALLNIFLLTAYIPVVLVYLLKEKN